MRSQANAMGYAGVTTVGPAGLNCRCCYGFKHARRVERRRRRAHDRVSIRGAIASGLQDMRDEREDEEILWLDGWSEVEDAYYGADDRWDERDCADWEADYERDFYEERDMFAYEEYDDFASAFWDNY